jgi:hypothetical protein
MGSGGTRTLWPANPALMMNIPLLTLRLGLVCFCLVVVVGEMLSTTTSWVCVLGFDADSVVFGGLFQK